MGGGGGGEGVASHLAKYKSGVTKYRQRSYIQELNTIIIITGGNRTHASNGGRGRSTDPPIPPGYGPE